MRAHPRPTVRVLAREGGTQFLTMLVLLLLWALAVTPWAADGEVGSWTDAADAARSVGAVALVVAVLVLLGHVAPTVVLRQVSWLWTLATTAVVTLAWSAVQPGTLGADGRSGPAVSVVLFLVLLVVGVTVALRTFVRPLRPVPALCTPLTAASAHAA